MFFILTGTRLKSVHSFGLVILEIDKMSPLKDGGKYCCIARNSSGQATSEFDVSVKPQTLGLQTPKFTQQLQVKTSIDIQTRLSKGKSDLKLNGKQENTAFWLRYFSFYLVVSEAKVVTKLTIP